MRQWHNLYFVIQNIANLKCAKILMQQSGSSKPDLPVKT